MTNHVLEENLERTVSANPFDQLGGYVKRCQGLTAYIKIENPPGTRSLNQPAREARRRE